MCLLPMRIVNLAEMARQATSGWTATDVKRSMPMAWALMLLGAAAGCAEFLLGYGYAAFQCWAVGAAGWLWIVIHARGAGGWLVKLFAWIGAFSYSLYVINEPVIIALNAIFFEGRLQVSIWPSYFATATLLVMGYLLYLVCERPVLQMLQRQRITQRRLAEAPTLVGSTGTVV